MRAVILQMGVSLDGYVARPDSGLEWGLPPEDEAVTAWKLDSVRRAGTHIMGRVTYEAMAAYWPTSTGTYAAEMNSIPKVVFSASLPNADAVQSVEVDSVETAEKTSVTPQRNGNQLTITVPKHGKATVILLHMKS